MMNPGVAVITESIMGLISPLVFIAFIDLWLLVAPVLFEVVFGFALRRYMKQLDPVAEMQRAKFGDFNAGLNETISGIEVVKAMAQEAQEQQKFLQNARSYRDYFVKEGEIQAAICRCSSLASPSPAPLPMASTCFLLTN